MGDETQTSSETTETAAAETTAEETVAAKTTAETTTEETAAPDTSLTDALDEKPAETKADDKKDDSSQEDEAKAEIDVAAFQLPEGVQIAESDATALTELAKEHGLNQEQAQAIVSLQANRELARIQQEQVETDTEVNSWKEAIKNDEKYGGDNLDQTKAAMNMLSEVFDKEQMEFLKETSIVFHPTMFPFFMKLAQGLKESPVLLNAEGSSSEENLASKMFNA